MSSLSAAVLLAVLSAGAPAADPDRACPSLPQNIVAPGVYRTWVEDLISRSPTLLAQCQLIAASPDVTVRITAARPQSCCRAAATFRRERDGRLCAVIALPVSVDFAELLAHEFEHVLEQIEGIDLAVQARIRDSGVYRVSYRRYETVRAREAGRAAAREILGLGPQVRKVHVMASDR